MHTVMDWVQVFLLIALVVVIVWGLIGEAREQNALRNEIELLHERMNRAGFPDRLPVHVAVPEPRQAGDDAPTTVMPVVGRHRREGAARNAPVVDVDA